MLEIVFLCVAEYVHPQLCTIYEQTSILDLTSKKHFLMFCISMVLISYKNRLNHPSNLVGQPWENEILETCTPMQM